MPGGSSSDPAARARSLANLRPNAENLVPGAGAWEPGESPHLEHGARTQTPQRSPEWSPAVQAAIGDLEQRVGAELRDRDGEVHAWAQPSIEAVALQRVAAWRVDRYVSDREAKGRLKPEYIDMQSKVAERYHRALEREALTLRSRLETVGGAFDLARHWAQRDEQEDDNAAEPVDGEAVEGRAVDG